MIKEIQYILFISFSIILYISKLVVLEYLLRILYIVLVNFVFCVLILVILVKINFGDEIDNVNKSVMEMMIFFVFFEEGWFNGWQISINFCKVMIISSNFELIIKVLLRKCIYLYLKLLLYVKGCILNIIFYELFIRQDKRLMRVRNGIQCWLCCCLIYRQYISNIYEFLLILKRKQNMLINMFGMFILMYFLFK